MAQVDIDDLRKFLGLSSSADVEGLQEVLDATIERIQSMVTVSLDGEPTTHQCKPATNGALIIPAGATELVALTAPDGTDHTAATDVDVDLEAGLIWLPWPASLTQRPWTVTVRRPQAGAAINLAIKIIAKHLWGVHRGSGGRAGPRGGVSAQDEPALSGFAIPRRARELLEPYTRPGGFA